MAALAPMCTERAVSLLRLISGTCRVVMGESQPNLNNLKRAVHDDTGVPHAF